MSALSREYPGNLVRVIGHAKRLAKLLASLESHEADVWFRGRAGELRGVVSLALADWRSGVSDAEAASHAILSYVDTLHRGIANKRRCGVGLDCCRLDEVMTAGVAEACSRPPAADAESTEPLPATNGPTAPARWVDGAAVLALVREGLPLVDRSARATLRRVGEAHTTLDDLRGFGREGLLDAARAFDEHRGVPFGRWAALRIRNAMIDGVRRWGPLAVRARQRPHDRDALPSAPGGARAPDPSEGLGASDGSDSERLSPPPAPHGGQLGVGEGSSRLAATPEDLLKAAQIAALVREIVADLPNPERTLIERSYFEGLTPEQAAASIGVSRSWGHEMHARAIARIERELRKRDRTTDRGGNGWTTKRP
jgi:RNA polymerase sigma factor for flagellar operon FliA